MFQRACLNYLTAVHIVKLATQVSFPFTEKMRNTFMRKTIVIDLYTN